MRRGERIVSARDEAAKRYVHPLDATPLTTTADRRVEDFKAGWDAALAEPTDAEIWEACRVHYLAKNGFDGWEQVTLRDADENIRWMFEAIKAFLAARKGKTP